LIFKLKRLKLYKALTKFPSLGGVSKIQRIFDGVVKEIISRNKDKKLK